jgi:hypothetical protein
MHECLVDTSMVCVGSSTESHEGCCFMNIHIGLAGSCEVGEGSTQTEREGYVIYYGMWG